MPYILTAAILGALTIAGGIALSAADGQSRPNCPGQIGCPLTGERVCADRCPVAEALPITQAKPVCCRGE